MLIPTLILFAGQLLILAMGLLWQRAIVPIEESVVETLLRLGPGLLIKTALGSLVLVLLSRLTAFFTSRTQQNHTAPE
jgi:biotin transporter BioY